MIHVCYSINDKNGKYTKILGTSMCSLFENTECYLTVHILHDETLSSENMNLLINMARKYGQIIYFHKIDISGITNNYSILNESKFSIATFYRLMIPEILPSEISKAIYLDADTIVNIDIVSLWEENINQAALGVVMDTVVVKLKRNPNAIDNRYFNSGVLVMNLDAIRSMGYGYMLQIADRLWPIHPEWIYDDQDVLNYIFADKCCYISEEYNYFANRKYEKQYKSPLDIKVIAHYIDITLNAESHNPFAYLFWHYFTKTPWCDANFMMDAFGMSNKLMDNKTVYLRNLFVSLMKRNRHIYCAERNNEKIIKTIYPYGENDEYWYLENWEALRDYLPNLQGDKDVVVIFFTNDYVKWLAYMIKLGFEEGKDFFDGLSLFANREGGSNLLNQERVINRYILDM